MAYLASRPDRRHDRQRRGAQPTDRRGGDVEAKTRRRQDGVERAAVADVAADAFPAGELDLRVERGGEGRHAVEGDVGTMICDVHDDGAAGALHNELGVPVVQGNAAGPSRPAAESERGVTAHGAEPGVVHEQHAECGGRSRRDDEGAVHLGVAARFQHEAPAVQVEPCGGIVPSLQHRAATRLGETFEDEAHRLAACVHLDGSVAGDGAGGAIGHAAGVTANSFVDNGPGLDLEARCRAEGCPRG